MRSCFFDKITKIEISDALYNLSMKPISRIRNHQGMTLIEVLVAMLILAVTLVAALRTATTATTNQMVLTERLMAEWVGRNAIAERRLGLRPWRDSGELIVEYVMNGQTYLLTEVINYVPGANRDFRLVQISVASQAKPKATLFRAVDFARRPL